MMHIWGTYKRKDSHTKLGDTDTKLVKHKKTGGHKNKNGRHNLKMGGTDAKWGTQRQNGGHKHKMGETNTKWGTQT